MALAVVSCGCDGPAPSPPPAGTAPAASPAARATGILRGRVRHLGPPPVPAAVEVSDGDCFAHHLKHPLVDESVLVSADGGLAGVVVFVSSGLPPDRAWFPPAKGVRLAQLHCRFQPRILTMTRGQSLEIANDDDLSHDAHGNPRRNEAFHFNQSPGATTAALLKTAEGPFAITCERHPWMRAWVAVFDHPFHAVTSADGTYEIRGVPAGDVELTFWHEALGERRVRAAVPEGGTASAETEFGR